MAPLTHYVFMEFSGLYDSPGHHAASALPADPHSMHEGSIAEPAVSNYLQRLQQTGPALLHCSYADLFATFAASLAGDTAQAGLSVTSRVAYPAPQTPEAEVLTSFRSRAPPRA